MAHLGSPSRLYWYGSADGRYREILKWPKDSPKNGSGVALYASAGASSRAMVGGRNPRHRIEVFTGLDPECDDLAPSLGSLAKYPADFDTALDHFHTIPSDEPIIPRTDMHAFLLTDNPLEDILPTLNLPDGVHVDFLRAIPIFASELEYKKKNGAEGLSRLWKDSGTPFWDPFRSPAVKG